MKIICKLLAFSSKKCRENSLCQLYTVLLSIKLAQSSFYSSLQPSNYHSIGSGVPQSRVLTRYSTYCSVIPVCSNITTATFEEGTALQAFHINLKIATSILQAHLYNTQFDSNFRELK